MNPIFEKLLVLQDRDSRLLRATVEFQRIPEERTRLDEIEKRTMESLEQAKSDVKRLETDRRKLEGDVTAKEELVRKYKNQLLEIKNNDQFHALQHEITMAGQEVRKIEDAELGIMEQLELAQAAVKAAEIRMKEEAQRLAIQRKDLDEKTVVLEKQVGDLQKERAGLAVEIEPEILSRYERIALSKHGQAMVRISHGMCMGCHLKLTAQEVHNAQSGANELVTCTNCGRILYWTPE